MKKATILLFLILVITFVLRLYRIGNPVADWHSWRQADTASVSKTFIEKGINVLYPTYQDISNVPSGMDNPRGYRFVEFPVFNVIHAVLVEYVGFFSLETWGRLISVVSAVFSAVFIYLIAKKYAGDEVGLFAAFFYAVLPFSIYFGRTILPDTLMTACWLGSIYFFAVWTDVIDKNKPSYLKILYFLLSLVLASLSLLLKPFAMFFLLPIAVICYQTFGFKMFKKPSLYVFVVVSLLPLIFWRIWIMQSPEGIPNSSWLINGGGIMFTGAFFYWIFAERIGKLILGYFGTAIMILGLVQLCRNSWLRPVKESRAIMFLSFVLSAFLYVFIIARGNVQHDYYQIPIIPSVVFLLGLGAAFLFNPGSLFSKIATRIILFVLIIMTAGFSWFYVRDYFNINNVQIVAAGQAVDRLTPKDALVIAPYGGDTTLLYHTNRQGWASFQNSTEELIKKGADYLIIVNPTDQDRQGVGSEYEIVSSEKDYLLIKLSD